MHIVDILIIVAFLIATLHIGFSTGKKIKTFNDYAIGNRKFSDFAIFCTVAATAIGGTTTMGGVGKSYEIGITQFLAQIGMPISFIIVGTFLARRFGNYYGCCSLGDMFYKSYGLTGKVLAGITGCIYEILGVGLQFIAMSTAINILTGFSYMLSLFISATIILIYTGRGGIRAVTFTDVLQFMVLILAIPILLTTVLGKIGGVKALFDQLPCSHVTITGENLHRYMFLIFPLMLPTLSPIHVQRLLMTSNREQGVKAYYNLCWIYLFIAIMVIFLGLTAKVLYPHLYRADQALFTLIINCLPAGVFGVAVIGILAVLMSTADSSLNSGSIMFVNDVVTPFIKHPLSEAAKLKMARIASLFIGFAAIIFASQRAGLFETKILVRTIWLSIILSPLYFLLFNMKISIKGLLISVVIGVGTFIFWDLNIKPITKIDGLFPGFFANVITVLFFYFLGGRQRVFSEEELKKIHKKEQAQAKGQLNMRALQMRNNVILGLCLVFLQLMPLIFGSGVLTYSKLLLTLVNGTMAILLIFGGSLEFFAEEKRFKWLKLTTLFFCLPVTSAYLLLTSKENGLSLITLTLSLMVMFMSVKKEHTSKLMITSGFIGLITLVTFIQMGNKINWISMFGWHHLFYLLGFLAVLFLIHSNLRILQHEKTLAIYHERYDMARSLSHDLMSPLMVFHLIVGNKKTIELDEKESQILKNVANEIGNYIDNFIVGSLKNHPQLKLEDLNQCVINCIEKQKILHKNLEIQLQANETFLARVDSILLYRIINNLLNTCQHALPNGCNTIVISINHDLFGNTQMLLQAANGSFSAKAINDMFINDQKLGDEVELGINFQEYQHIIAKWRSKLEIIVQDDNATIQILFPGKDCDKLLLQD